MWRASASVLPSSLKPIQRNLVGVQQSQHRNYATLNNINNNRNKQHLLLSNARRTELINSVKTKERRQRSSYSTFTTRDQYDAYSNRDKARRRSFLVGLAAGSAFLISGLWITDRILHPELPKEKERPTVVVVGSGWGGMSAVKELDTNRYDIVLISPRNYFLFTPLLAEFTFGKMDEGSIAYPVRTVFQEWGKKGVKFIEATVTGVNSDTQTLSVVTVADGKPMEVKYDKLILSVGSSYTTDGVTGVKEFCYSLKDIQDGRAIKKKVLDSFESASLGDKSEEEIRRLLHFVVVGGDPAAIKVAKELNDFVNDISRNYPKLVPKVNITMVANREQQFLNIYETNISKYYVNHTLKPLLVSDNTMSHIKLSNQKVKSVTKDNLILEKDGKVPYGVCIWMSGKTPNPLIASLQKKVPKKQHNQHALITSEWLQVKGFDNIYAIGECATMDQGHILQKWDEIFADLDENGDGFIDEAEFKKLDEKYSRRYPQLLAYAAEATRTLFFEGDVNQDGKLSKDEFEDLLAKVDSHLTSLPPTAQSALQQGRYLGSAMNSVLKEREVRRLFRDLDEDRSGYLDAKEIKRGLRRLRLPCTKKDIDEFIAHSDSDADNKIDEEEFVTFVLQKQQQGGTGDWKKLSHTKILPFRYKHLGGFEYVGYDSGITERGSEGKAILEGFGAWWMYNSVYSSKVLSNQKKARILTRLTLGHVYDRDLVKDYVVVKNSK